MKSATILPILNVLFVVYFWTFNICLLLIVLLGLIPLLGWQVVADTFSGEVPLDIVLPLVGLVGVPTTCTVAGLLPRQAQPATRTMGKVAFLRGLFFGVETPLLLLCVVRFFWLKELTLSSGLILGTAFLAIATYAWHLFVPQPRSRLIAGLQLGGHTLMLATGLYVLSLTAFFIPPLLWIALKRLEVTVLFMMYSALFFPITVVLYTITLTTLAGSLVFLRRWWNYWEQTARTFGRWMTSLITMGLLGVWLTLFVVSQTQPQQQAFDLLAQPPQTNRDRQELLERSATIRQGLLNAYLSPYRYFSSWDDSQSIAWLYRDSFGLSEEMAEAVQRAHNLLMSPFLYQGHRFDDPERAAALYAQFFDTPILKAEPQAIKHALASTFDRSQASAGLQDINQRKVWLAQQQVNLTPHGDWAEVELYEVYEGRTPDQQEVFYYFSLPESAVVTGLWLGNSSDRTQRFPFQVASRGAAQQVYTQEVTRHVDPALLEQVGPSTYRLRAFPIPGQGQGQMHLWLTYKALQQPQGWPLPVLQEKRNVFWTRDTQRTYSGKSVKGYQAAWLPAAIATQTTQPAVHRTTLSDGQQLTAKPWTASHYLPQNQRFAVILDSSRSMAAQQQSLAETLNWLQTQIADQNQVDVFVPGAASSQAAPINLQQFRAEDITYFGTLEPKEMLRQFNQTRGTTDYAALLLITDTSGYELSDDTSAMPSVPAPLWMVHLGGGLPAYDDATFQAIQASQGGAVSEVAQVFQHLAAQSTLGATLVNLTDNYVWITDDSASAVTDPDFAPLAARQWITRQVQQLNPQNVAQLDQIHAVAQRYGIVSPYSSMIVLVNDRQQQNLNQAEQGGDRFEREAEDQQLPTPGNANILNQGVPAVPEPALVILLLTASLLLVGLYQLIPRPLSASAVVGIPRKVE